MLEHFGEKVRGLRLEKGISREELCGDEAELSVRQLARIELGQSIPSLAKVIFIAKALEVSVGYLTDGANLELPKRYKELKYLILRTPTYMDDRKLQVRESQFDEIFENYYDQLPEEEQLIIECLQATLDTLLSENINFGVELLQEYFKQTKVKQRFKQNDLILIELYLAYLDIEGMYGEYSDKVFYDSLLDNLLKQFDDFELDELFIVNKIIIDISSLSIKTNKLDNLEKTIAISQKIMAKIQDWNRMPILKLIEWKYFLIKQKNRKQAEESYTKACLFAQITGDKYLEEQLIKEWEKDICAY
ncbi:helix-turn-helix domain-containing protein [Streptococcus dysgalactiae]|uniref:Helix-turn-helix domain-containing protein n=1 Tax=Streptococcus dysgalactiae subsp. equisimilis TaxID=119602 RepID=A0AB38Y2D4_STREQ|nr:XRE family transcriptional regulator [Streptococcus dysgalactiae]QQY17989.1 helix-turn-helix domain-containing protein [Streptococcus dysgalactiae]TYK96299.1 XRE family transcriptional regulator [Streptococcus dysgalactiae]TYL00894.1 XRE family transcriptional regulator [Streptococcus dysgalactiae]WEQ79487.1 helix-turn-helix domain-containing protein [Streptococcus dysgalactiae subsp. equisimilis]WHM79218.1 helix-turn-helix domain-containing protein [Streptococcus dysgalactiae subsp. equisi